MQGGRFVKNELGAEMEFTRCDACGMEEIYCGFSPQIWHKQQRVRVCRACKAQSECVECKMVKSPKKFSQTQICRICRHRMYGNGKAAVWSCRCNPCLRRQAPEGREEQIVVPKPLAWRRPKAVAVERSKVAAREGQGQGWRRR